MPPLGDAVRLVDGEERHVRMGQMLEERVREQALRRDIEKVEHTGAQPANHIRYIVGRERRVELGGADTEL